MALCALRMHIWLVAARTNLMHRQIIAYRAEDNLSAVARVPWGCAVCEQLDSAAHLRRRHTICDGRSLGLQLVAMTKAYGHAPIKAAL
jgi:hypothetical protein